MPKYRISFDTGEEKTVEAVRQEFSGAFVSFFADLDGSPSLVASYPSDAIVSIERQDPDNPPSPNADLAAAPGSPAILQLVQGSEAGRSDDAGDVGME